MSMPDIFISYSRTHVGLVSPLTAFLGVGGSTVFQDESSIKPGEEWETVIRQSLAAAKLMVLIWCEHALKSEWVNKEIELASVLQKQVVPVLLDDTPLPEYMAKFQWIDFRGAFPHDASGEPKLLRMDGADEPWQRNVRWAIAQAVVDRIETMGLGALVPTPKSPTP